MRERRWKVVSSNQASNCFTKNVPINNFSKGFSFTKL